jgi:hypothetical protein
MVGVNRIPMHMYMKKIENNFQVQNKSRKTITRKHHENNTVLFSILYHIPLNNGSHRCIPTTDTI